MSRLMKIVAADEYNEEVEDKKIAEDPADTPVPDVKIYDDDDIQAYVLDAIESHSPILLFYENYGWRKVYPERIKVTKAGNTILSVKRANGDYRSYRLDRIEKVQFPDSDEELDSLDNIHRQLQDIMNDHGFAIITVNNEDKKVKPTDWDVADNTVYLKAYTEDGSLQTFDIEKITSVREA